MKTCLLVLLIAAMSVPALAQNAEVRRIRSYRMELEETLGGGEEGGNADAGAVLLTRMVPGTGPQETAVAFRSVELEGEEKPWERRTVLLMATITSNHAARASRREYCFREGVLVLCTIHADTAEIERQEYYFNGKKTVGCFRVTGSTMTSLSEGESSKRAASMREAGERIAAAFRALVGVREDMDGRP